MPTSAPAVAGLPDPDVLVVTGDDDLRRRLEALAASAGVLVRSASLPVVPGLWQRARLVLVGADVAAGTAGGVPGPRRAGVVVVADAPAGAGLWRDVVRLGADHVALLPESQTWLVERIARAGSPAPRASTVVGVVGGRSGAGASVLAAMIAICAGELGKASLLVDADPLGPGADLLVGAEDVEGLAWEDLGAARGRLRPGLLASMLPRVDDVSLLGWRRDGPPGAGQSRRADLVPPLAAVEAVVTSAAGDFDVVVVDLPRTLVVVCDDLLPLLAACRVVLMVVPAEVRAAAAAARLAGRLRWQIPDLRLVVRGPSPVGLPAAAVSDALDLPLAAELRAEPRLTAMAERGLLPALSARGPLRTFCRRLLRDELLVPAHHMREAT